MGITDRVFLLNRPAMTSLLTLARVVDGMYSEVHRDGKGVGMIRIRQV